MPAGMSVISWVVGLGALGSFVVGFVVFVLGMRGRPRFSEPRCAGCGYDLRGVNFLLPGARHCSECGLDLSDPASVNFGRFERRRGRAVIGAMLMVLAVLLPVAWMLVARQAAARAAAAAAAARAPMRIPPRPYVPYTPPAPPTTQAILARLPSAVANSSDWSELERRLRAGELTRQDVDAVFGILIKYVDGARAAAIRVIRALRVIPAI